MPVERVSQGFKDISMTFQVSPLNNDAIVLKNINSITRSIRNIVYTLPGEKFFNPKFGSNITATLFESIDEFSASIIKTEIETSIRNFEPRVKLNAVAVTPDFDNYAFDVVINYEIIGISIPPQQLEFALLSAR
jgi:phage baseplate assembly protein W